MKKILHRLYLLYERHFPISRGKFRVGELVDRLIGRVAYKIDGLILMLSPVSLLDRLLIRGDYDRFVVDVVNCALSDGGNLIDIGANIGYVSLTAAKLLDTRGKVFSFEPSPREYWRLCDHCRVNAATNVVTANKGIGPIVETAVLRIADLSNPGMNSRHSIRPTVEECEAMFVPIDEAIPHSELAKSRCVKIDVEGDEMNVLRSFAPVMPVLQSAAFIVEITPSYLARAGDSAADIYHFFSEAGFLPLRPASLQATGQYDEVFVHPAGRQSPRLLDVVRR